MPGFLTDLHQKWHPEFRAPSPTLSENFHGVTEILSVQSIERGIPTLRLTMESEDHELRIPNPELHDKSSPKVREEGELSSDEDVPSFQTLNIPIFLF